MFFLKNYNSNACIQSITLSGDDGNEIIKVKPHKWFYNKFFNKIRLRKK